jgi:hypothetical protein
MWFADPLKFLQHKQPLEPQERQVRFDGALLAMSLGLFLFERYYRIKSGTHDVEPNPNTTGKDWDAEFKKCASSDLDIDLDFLTAFWTVFRNGIQHQGMPKRVHRGYKNKGKIWHYWDISVNYPPLPQVHWISDTEMVICISPWKFAEFMIYKFETEPTMLDKGFNHAFGEIRADGVYHCVPVPVQ